MADPPWKSLVARLVDEGYQSPYLTRLRERYEIGRGRPTLEQEILQEMASALARAEDRVNHALLELELLGRRADADPSEANLAAFDAQRERAISIRRDLQIHREALHFPRDRSFEERYPIPPRRGR